MATEHAQREVARFLKTAEPEVLCIRGKWGVGKTFSWKAFLKAAQDQRQIGLTNYAYVSLFGVNSLDQLKLAIFENLIELDTLGTIRSPKDLVNKLAKAGKEHGRKLGAKAARFNPWKNFSPGAEALFFSLVSDVLICIDDLERKGTNLPFTEMLGLVSDLREQRRCKVVLLLNDDALTDKDRDEFARYNEKVIDRSLLFEPTPEECAQIGAPGKTPADAQIREKSVKLGIANIRVIKKIVHMVRNVEPALAGFDPSVMNQAVHSLCLFGWSVYAEGAVPIAFIRDKQGQSYFGLRDPRTETEEEKAWTGKLSDFGFGLVDDFDEILLQGVQKGFFDIAPLTSTASELDRKFKSSNGALSKAWRLYHDHLGDDGAAVVDGIAQAFREEVTFTAITMLNATVTLLKDLGRAQDATDLIILFMATHVDKDKGFFDLSELRFAGQQFDPQVEAAVSAKFASFPDGRVARDVLLRISKVQAWSEEDMAFLARMTADDFYELFKAEEAASLRAVVHGSMFLGRVNGASAEMLGITAAATAALQRFADESPLDRYRLAKKYGLQFRDQNGAAAGGGVQ